MNGMKNKIFFFILVLLCEFSFFSQSLTQYGWEWLNPKPTHAPLVDIKFANVYTGYCVGSGGTILKTTNRGLDWSFLHTWVQPGFYDYKILNVFNAETLIVVGNSPNFYKSTNGGSTWTVINSGVSAVIFGMNFRNDLTGYAVGEWGTVLKTTSGGYSWQQINTNYYLILSAVSFPDNNTGYAVGQKIVKTTNGGLTWDTSSAVTNANSVYFRNNMTGFIGANGLFMTTNGGLNWNDVSNGAYNCNTINFIDSLTGWVSAGNAVLKTTNGGFNWINVSGSQGSGICFVDSLNGYACSGDSYGSIIRRTTDGGSNWSLLSSKFESGDIYALYFLNENTGFYGGTSGNLRKTTNGGHNWSTLLSSSSFVESIYFIDENTGFVGQTNGASAGQIRKTTSAGVNWTSVGVPNPVNAMMFANINTGYALGSRSHIYKTTNSGLNWMINVVPSEWINGIWVLNSNTVVAVGSYTSGMLNSVVVKTTNGGQNWVSRNYNWGSSGNAVCFTDQNTGYVACGLSGYGGRVYKTTDFCETWTYQNIGFGYSLNAIQFFDSNTGIVSGHNGTAAITTNAGVTWLPYYRITDYHFFAMHCVNQDICYFGGWYDIMLKTSNGGMIVGTEMQNIALPKVFKLSQNYPNPFNPLTKIKYDIKKTGFTKLVVYDILGREIVTLVNEELKPGTYETEWDASGFTSGIYFYRLSTGENTQTRKMVLIK